MKIRRVLIFLNGDLPDPDAARYLCEVDDHLVAVDGGLKHVRALGLVPHLLIGDLDSVSPEDLVDMRSRGVEIRKYPAEKDETDFELALQYALNLDPDEILVVAGLGGRLDQTIGNIFLLADVRLNQKKIRLDDGRVEALLVHDEATITGRVGDIVSLLPLFGPVENVLTWGLRYPLRSETLYPDRTRGISNVMIAETAGFSISKGIILCIHSRRTLSNRE